MCRKSILCFVAWLVSAVCIAADVTQLKVVSVSNSDMVRMRELSAHFEKSNPGIKLEWIMLEENALRDRLTKDIIANRAEFDVFTIGMYEAPIWGKKGWLTKIGDLPTEYHLEDIFPAVSSGLSYDGELYALPFYAESSMTYYRNDLFEAKRLRMPAQPTWDEIRTFAEVLHDPKNGVYGICARGKAGWGENMALITTIANTFGARWFDESWVPEFTGDEWIKSINFYVELLQKYGPPNAVSNGFKENLALFKNGKCAIWVDATVAGSFLIDASQSKVVEHVDYALAPKQTTSKGSGWLWSWALAIPSTSKEKDAAKEFIVWATSKEYSRLVADTNGIANMPPGVRASTYNNPNYIEAAPFAIATLQSMYSADPNDATLKPSPYVGVQFAAIPEFQSIASQVGNLIATALNGEQSVEQALEKAQEIAMKEMTQAGYYGE